ncbi:MAG: thiamine pyrophosphate-dependent enzyme [Dehalococcoidia bacterium]
MTKERVTGKPELWMRTENLPIPSCPGCQEPVAVRLILEVLEEMGLVDRSIMVVGVGCSCILPLSIDIDYIMCAHGRPPDGATAMKRVLKDEALIFTLQGDGDCIAIGAGPLINAAIRGEKFTIIMLNNATYGTTGGQLAPTTLMGQRTSTTPLGRSPGEGYPVHVPEMLTSFEGVAYTARGAVNTPANYQRTRRYVRAAFQKQLENAGLSFVEILVACPPDWRMTPLESLEWIGERMISEYPLGEFKHGSSAPAEPEPAAVPVRGEAR